MECGVTAIQLTQGRYALIDTADAAALTKHRWRARLNRRTWYVSRTLHVSTNRLMHHDILGTPPGKGLQVDHINGDGLDNRRANIRWATPAQNQWNQHNPMANRHGLTGVCSTRSARWTAGIHVHGRRRHLGTFDTPEEAHRAYLAAARLRAAARGETGDER